MTVEDFILARMRAQFLAAGEGPRASIQGEKELALHFGVQVKTMRRVLARLEQEGRLRMPESAELKPSVREMIELFEAREAIEGMAARLVARRGLNPDAAQQLRAMAEMIDHYIMDDQQSQVEKQFHQRVVELSGNTLLTRMHALVLPILLGRLPTETIRPVASESKAPLRQAHLKLVDVLMDGSEEDAERVFREHCTKVIHFTLAEARGIR